MRNTCSFRSAVALVVLALGAGCLTAQDPGGVDEGDRTAEDSPEPGAAQAINVSTERGGAEPVVAVARDGAVFVQGIAITTFDVQRNAEQGHPSHVWRSTDGGRTWTPIDPPDAGSNGTADGFLAVGLDDTVYVVNAFAKRATFLSAPGLGSRPAAPPGTVHVFASEDRGDSWQRLTPPAIPGDVHRTWLHVDETGSLHLAATTQAPRYDAQPLWYVRSDDGGRTWTEATMVHERRSYGTDLARGPDGTLYIGIWTPHEGSSWTLARSADGGQTWEHVPAGPPDAQEGFASSWQSLSVDEEGRLSISWVQQVNGTARALVSISEDGGETWSPARAVALEGGAQMLAWSEATGAGELAYSWYRADAGAGEPTRWRPEIALVAIEDGQPRLEDRWQAPWTVHRGAICEGTVCEGGPEGPADWHVMDFTWISEGPDEGLHAGFASTRWDRAGSFPVYATAAPG